MSDDPAWLQNDNVSSTTEWDDPNVTTEKKIMASDGTSFSHARRYASMETAEKDDFHRLLATRGFRFLHIASASLMYAACIVSFMRAPGFGEFFIAIYTSLFASILAGYELSRAYEV
jgi:hypothetical protein